LFATFNEGSAVTPLNTCTDTDVGTETICADFALAEDVSEVALQGGVGRGEEDERRVASRGAGAEEEGEGGVGRGESVAADTWMRKCG